jgi:DNA-binding CsgD family transcriptional regulator/DNA-directed RNA polymerase subunit RPC12/RpoP
VTRSRLAAEFEQGRSLSQIARELGVHPSTVGYWAAKHGLQPPHARKYARRGAPDREKLERLVAEGATLKEIGAALDRSTATVRHWLKRWGIERVNLRHHQFPPDAPRDVDMSCPRHGLTRFRLDNRGSYRCLRCRQERVAERRRTVKRILVAEAGGRCARCGYDQCIAALQFHHLDPSTKSFTVSSNGVTRSIERARQEARKCILLCANCHAEVEAGFETPRGGFEPPRTD